MQLTAVLTPAEEGGLVAMNPETGTWTQGETIEEAIGNLKEATALYLEEFPLAFTGHPLVTMFSLPKPAHASTPPGFRGRGDPRATAHGLREGKAERQSRRHAPRLDGLRCAGSP